MTDSKDLKDEFREEALEHLEHIEKELVLLEKHPSAERIAPIFRSIHSIKGAAGFMSYQKMSGLAHTMETLLQMLRQGSICCEKDVIDVLLAGTDMLRQMLRSSDKGENTDTRMIQEGMRHLIESCNNPDTLKKMETDVSLSDINGQDSGFSVSEFRLGSLPGNYTHLFVLKCNLNELQNKLGIKPDSLIRLLLRQGLILDSRAETRADDFEQDLRESPLIWNALYATSLTSDEILSLTASDDMEIREVRYEGKKTHSAKQQTAAENIRDEIPPSPPQIPAEERNSADSRVPAESGDLPDTVRIRVELLDQLMKLAGELVLVRNNLLRMTLSEKAFRGISQRLNIVTSEMQESIMQARMQPVEKLFAKLPRIVRDLCRKLGKEIEIRTLGSETELDKSILEALTDPMIHLIRNCCDHGIEMPETRRRAGKPPSGRIRVRAWHESGQINLEVRDDGRGFDTGAIRDKALENGLKSPDELSRMNEREILNLILLSGFSTAADISDISGRGVGMDVVRDGVERLGGSIDLSTDKGEGSCVHLRLPLTLAIIPCLLVEAGGQSYAIPQSDLAELVCLRNQDVYTRIEIAGEQEVFRLRNRLLPMVRLHEVFRHRRPFTRKERAEISSRYAREAREIISGQKESKIRRLHFLVLKIGTKPYGLIVDEIKGVEEVVVNPVHSALKSLSVYAGTTITGNGNPALILDAEGLAAHADVQFNLREEEQTQEIFSKEEYQSVLLFKSGPREQFAIPLPMIRRIEPIRLSRIEKIGNKEFVAVENISCRLLRMENILHVSDCTEKEKMLLLLPKHIRRPFGILLSEVVDTVITPLQLNRESHMEDGLLGTALIRDHMTLFLDIYRLIERAEPEWFAERKKSAPPPDERRSILLLEDTSFFRNLIKDYLETDGYEVTAVENGQEGMALIQKKHFDMIISDIDMPVMDGWDFMRYIRGESPVPDIPAIALTALDSDADREKAQSVGFNGYQIKLDREELLVNVSKSIMKE